MGAECALQCIPDGIELTEEGSDDEDGGWYSNLCFIKCRRETDNSYWGCAKECDIPKRITSKVLCYSECRGTTTRTMLGCALRCYDDSSAFDPKDPDGSLSIV